MCFCLSLLFGFPRLFFFQYKSIVRRGVEFSKRICLLVRVSGLSRTKAVKLNNSAKTKYGIYFCDFLACHGVPCSEQCHRLNGKSRT